MAVETIRSDDFIEYFLFPPALSGQATDDDERDMLVKLLQQVDEISNKFTASYIWHKDSFNLKVRTRNSHLLKTENDSDQGESWRK